MPNWVRNRLTVGGEDYQKVLDELTETDYERGYFSFDFNRIIEMPKELNIVAGSVTEKCMALYLTSINPNAEYYGKKKVSAKEFDFIIKKIQESGNRLNALELMLPVEKIKQYEKAVIGYQLDDGTKLKKPSALSYGKRAVDNILEFGHLNWYDWSLANWGTKWNACHSQFNGNVVEFDTAWSDVAELICKLSEKYPNREFFYEYAEEQTGLYSGELYFENGEEVGGDRFEEFSKRAYEKSFELWGGEEYFKYDKRSGTYELIDNEAEDGGSEM